MLLSDNADEQNIARTNRRCVGTFLLLLLPYILAILGPNFNRVWARIHS